MRRALLLTAMLAACAPERELPMRGDTGGDPAMQRDGGSTGGDPDATPPPPAPDATPQAFVDQVDTTPPAELAGLIYTDPPPGGRVRLVVRPSPPGNIALALVAAEALSGYSIGFDLPLDTEKVALDPANSFELGSALSAGAPPYAAGAVIAQRGPLAGCLLAALSQKADGAGAVSSDARIQPGDTFFTVHLVLRPGARPGTVFDGTGMNRLGDRFNAGLRDKSGTDVVLPRDFAIGKLELR